MATTSDYEADSHRDQQQNSILFTKIPQEIRDEIYSHVFLNTRLTYGVNSRHPEHRSWMKPAPNTLSILQTCRRIRDEIGFTWVSKVLFNFEEPKTMLRKLDVMPRELVLKIRLLRIVLDVTEEDNSELFLELLCSLNLERLVILGCKHGAVNYIALNTLVAASDGWKELHFICPNSEMLGLPRDRYVPNEERGASLKTGWRRPQPSDWQDVSERRDVSRAKPSVVIYRSTVPDVPCFVTKTETQEIFEQVAPRARDDKAWEDYAKEEDHILMADGEKTKEMMVVVKRGRDRDYTPRPLADGRLGTSDETGASPRPVGTPAESDAEYQERNTAGGRPEGPELLDRDNGDREEGCCFLRRAWEPEPITSVDVDVYTNVDDFEWPEHD